MKGLVIGGEFGKVLARQKAGESLELGELLIANLPEGKVLLQVTDLQFGSQVSMQNLELISGLKLEEGAAVDFFEDQLRNYTLAVLKSVLAVRNGAPNLSKQLPAFLSEIREITKEDVSFIALPKNPLPIGKLRSGSKILDVDVSLPGDKVFSHHILIPATTGRGKSNLTACMLWNVVDKAYCGILVLDPHDEYYGRTGIGLKDHPARDKVAYYTPNLPPPGAITLRLNIESIHPSHFSGVTPFSDPQHQALYSYYRAFGKKWIESIILEKPLESMKFHEGTLAVVKRKLLNLLDLDWDGQKLTSQGVFALSGGENTIGAICADLEAAKKVIIDTSSFSGETELLVGSLVCNEILRRYKHAKYQGTLDSKPVVNIILEEAPRVLGKEALERGPNIFSTIAREGRKFKVGLTAITQLPSLIPRDVLASMNTKIILGLEMAPERQAIIDSASQDLSDDSRAIASLDVGEAIITSNFSKFAIPVKIPKFEDLVKGTRNSKKAFPGMKP
ncbi:ATP-binding protein [Candidatus Woesearchaeota archaeon]|nr:ATP-binding protein [Candidatus Woesearchaeota archaeon]